MDKKTNLVWMDLEMTGLDANKDTILQVALIITDKDLNILNKGMDIVIHQPQEVLDNMNEWCIENHGKSGLTKRVQESTINMEYAEEMILEELQKYTIEKKSPLCGNSVYMDRYFLMKHMPEVNNYLHYRLIDVSTLSELYGRWYPNQPNYKKQDKHLALEDIEDSINQLKFLKEKIFKETVSFMNGN